jgi:hypothetical protein
MADWEKVLECECHIRRRRRRRRRRKRRRRRRRRRRRMYGKRQYLKENYKARFKYTY